MSSLGFSCRAGRRQLPRVEVTLYGSYIVPDLVLQGDYPDTRPALPLLAVRHASW